MTERGITELGMTDLGHLLPPGTILDAALPSAPPGTTVYDYGVLRPDRPGTLQCPSGRTDLAERAEEVIAGHLDAAPVGARAAILVRKMANDGTTGPAYLYAVAERTKNCVTWATHPGIRTSPSSEPPATRPDGVARPGRPQQPPDPATTMRARTA
jgi:hypothetical protein